LSCKIQNNLNKNKLKKSYLNKIEDLNLERSLRRQYLKFFNSFLFSLSEFKINKVGKSKKILEVGSGHALLLNYLTYKKYNIEGIEPIGKGFNSFKIIQKIANNIFAQKIKLHVCRFENLKNKKKFDHIFSDNVIEHVGNWKNFLRKKMELLKYDGSIVMFFPNYLFPIEMHFFLPILINKKITFKVFKKKIIQIEKKNHSKGLFSSLNFLNIYDIKRFCKMRGYKIYIDKEFTERRINFYFQDLYNLNNYKKSDLSIYSYLIYNLFYFIYNLGFFKIIKKLPLFFHPYLKIVITK